MSCVTPTNRQIKKKSFSWSFSGFFFEKLKFDLPKNHSNILTLIKRSIFPGVEIESMYLIYRLEFL